MSVKAVLRFTPEMSTYTLTSKARPRLQDGQETLRGIARRCTKQVARCFHHGISHGPEQVRGLVRMRSVNADRFSWLLAQKTRLCSHYCYRVKSRFRYKLRPARSMIGRKDLARRCQQQACSRGSRIPKTNFPLLDGKNRPQQDPRRRTPKYALCEWESQLKNERLKTLARVASFLQNCLTDRSGVHNR
jgi:hypothetical protein